MSKEMWFREFERILNEREAEIDEMPITEGAKKLLRAHAYDEAGEEAGPALAERLADMADFERKRRREEGK